MPLEMHTVAHKAERVRIQATRNEFPHSIEFNQAPAQQIGSVQPIQTDNRRYFGNIEDLLARERLRLLGGGAKTGQNTPGTGPAVSTPGQGGNTGGSGGHACNPCGGEGW